MEIAEQSRLIEALILAAPEPISLARLAQIVPDCTPGVVKDCINELNSAYQEQDRSFEIWEVAGGYQIRTRAEFSGYLQQLRKERPLRLSHAALESLAIVAYKQPVTRGELESVRGVDTGAVLKGLLERRLIRILGHKEVPGRPLLYGTSKRFLEVFGLESLKNLPSLRELEELAREQGVDLPGMDALGGSDAKAEGLGLMQDVSAQDEGEGEGEVGVSAEAIAADLASEGDAEEGDAVEDGDVSPSVAGEGFAAGFSAEDEPEDFGDFSGDPGADQEDAAGEESETGRTPSD